MSEYDANILTDTKEVADYYEASIKYLVLSIKNKNITPKFIANWIINRKADITKVSPEELVKLISQSSQKASIADEEIKKTVQKILAANPKAVSDYRAGKTNVLMFLVGLVMREYKGKVDATLTRKILEKELE